MAADATNQTTGSRPVRWKTGLLLLVLTPVCVLSAWIITSRLADRDRTIQMTVAISTLVVMIALQAVWWLGFARLSWRGRLLGACGVLLVAGAVASVVRIDGYRGEMLPILALRWESTPQERNADYFRQVERTEASRSLGGPVVIREGDWPQYRGPNRDGIVPGVEIPTNWEESPPRVVWKHPCGLGWSSFAVVGNRLFTQEQRGEEELVVCYAAATGKQLWSHEDSVRFSETLGGDGPRATPTIANGRVYALGATGLLNCLDAATGAQLWQRDILKDAGHGERIENLAWGMAGSPVVWEGRVYVVPGGEQGREVIAYDAESGDIAWAAGDGEASYAAPRIETIGGVPQLLIFDKEELKGFDPKTGTLLWSYGPFTNTAGVNAAQPIVVDNRILISSGYGVGSALLKITQTGTKTGEQWKVEEVWRHNNEFKLKFNDAVLHEGYLYGLDEGILSCYEFATGERQWKRGRYGYGQVILIGDVLVLLAEDGTLAAIRPTPEKFEELARVPVLDGKTWNHPAYAHGFLYVRNDRQMACLDLRPLGDEGGERSGEAGDEE